MPPVRFKPVVSPPNSTLPMLRTTYNSSPFQRVATRFLFGSCLFPSVSGQLFSFASQISAFITLPLQLIAIHFRSYAFLRHFFPDEPSVSGISPLTDPIPRSEVEPLFYQFLVSIVEDADVEFAPRPSGDLFRAGEGCSLALWRTRS